MWPPVNMTLTAWPKGSFPLWGLVHTPHPGPSALDRVGGRGSRRGSSARPGQARPTASRFPGPRCGFTTWSRRGGGRVLGVLRTLFANRRLMKRCSHAAATGPETCFQRHPVRLWGVGWGPLPMPERRCVTQWFRSARLQESGWTVQAQVASGQEDSGADETPPVRALWVGPSHPRPRCWTSEPPGGGAGRLQVPLCQTGSLVRCRPPEVNSVGAAAGRPRVRGTAPGRGLT